MRYILAFMLTVYAGLAGAQDLVMPPFYRGIEKTQAQLMADAAFVQRALQGHDGDRLAAVQSWIGMGWQAIAQGEGEDAIRRFNQAWLIDAAAPGIAYGMMIAAHIRGDDPAEVDGLYTEALAGMPEADHIFAHIDYAQILGQRGDFAGAIVIAEPFESDPRAAELLVALRQSLAEAGQ